jgi:metallo-beta-lactamase family protein
MIGAMTLRISFLGAADTVTGSRHLVDWGGTRVLLDCGMFQGYKTFRERNWAPVPPELHGLDAVVLSHAHLDHCGWLPVLARSAFRGPIYATPATVDLARVLLLDAAHLQEEDARRANRYGYSRHEKALPLYTRADAERVIARMVPLRPGESLKVGELQVQLTPVGHLLGACAITLARGREVLGYSGDVGRSDDLMMPAPVKLTRADVLLCEATYGNRWHAPEDAPGRLAELVTQAAARGGSVLLPSFAVGRAQALLLVLQRLRREGRIPGTLPIFLDSPMAIEATALYGRHRDLLRVPREEIAGLLEGVHVVAGAPESVRLARHRYPCVIISASGMATGGRVLHHLKAMAPDPRHEIVFAGFQVGGSRGSALVAGATEVKIHGEYVPVRARVSHLEGFSGHADSDGLMAWMRGIRRAPRQTWVVHGDPQASDALRVRIQDELGWKVAVPAHGATLEA